MCMELFNWGCIKGILPIVISSFQIKHLEPLEMPTNHSSSYRLDVDGCYNIYYYVGLFIITNSDINYSLPLCGKQPAPLD